MTQRKNYWTSCMAALGFIILILDAKTAVSGARDGLLLCINVVVPSLFPFFVLSAIVNSMLTGMHWRFLRPIGKLCGIPKGGESFLLLGLLGGYPVGAQCISDAYSRNLIDKDSAKRMLGFCNNAGPAFIFGMLGNMFDTKTALWCLWGIHILSAILVGIILPNKKESNCSIPTKETISIHSALDTGIKNIAFVCGWVILFRVILTFTQRWFLWLMPDTYQTVIAGILELSNGCLGLHGVTKDGLRYVLGAGFISFGGLCVGMQTMSTTKSLDRNFYFPGKILQTTFSLILAGITQYLIFSPQDCFANPWWCLGTFLMPCIILFRKKKKKVVAIP